MNGFNISGSEAQLIVSSIQRQQEVISQHLQSLEAAFRESATPQSAYDKSQGAPLTVVLNLRGLVARASMEVWVKSSGPADFVVAGSRNGKDYRVLYTLSITDPGGSELHEGFMNAYPVVRVSTEVVGDHEIEIVAAR